MIKGILLRHQPKMADLEEIEILSLVDPLAETEYVSERSKAGHKVERRVFEVPGLQITLLTTIDPVSLSAISGVWKILEKAAPDFMKVLELPESKVLVAWPRYQDSSESENYTSMMNELIRVAVFLLRTYGITKKDKVVELLKDYVEVCVSITKIDEK